MRYVSTRGEARSVGFLDALLAGLAPDGGLYVPNVWPRLTAEEIAGFAGHPYATVAADILGRFAGDDVAAPVMEGLCAAAYADFAHPAVTPLKQLGPGRFLLELFHGPTLAFKDLAMQVVARLYEFALAERGRALTLVCATSGDTGGAAVEAFAGRANIRLVALYPEGRISKAQRRFMTTSIHANVRAVAVAGDFDDCQAILKALFADDAFARQVGLSAVNSINIARIAAQTVYYFAAAAALGAPARRLAFAAPTGNLGDAYAGWAAARMGLPTQRIIVATNGNDIVARALQTGRYERRPALATQSPAMDIQVASNFERLYFECAGRDGPATAAAFRRFAAAGSIDLPPTALEAMREVFTGVSVSEAATSRAMAETLEKAGELVDPHTAVALAGADLAGEPGARAPLVALSTAHPAKFPDTVRAATGRSPIVPPAVLERADRPERFDRLPVDVEAVKAYVRAFPAVG
ncbi:MAG: threonine synthase [Caulobacteraceae bacterium]|nr:threonine synthase [Caulobacteraceae bacterium]